MEEKYEELGEEVDNVEEEIQGWICWKCGGAMWKIHGYGWKSKKESGKVIEKIKVNGNQPDGGMLHLYGQKKKAAKKAVDKARNDMEVDLYTKLDEDAGKKMIYKMARHRNENSKDVKGGTFIKDRNGKLVTNREEVLNVWEGHYSELLNHEGNMSDLELPNYVHEKVNVIEITDMD